MGYWTVGTDFGVPPLQFLPPSSIRMRGTRLGWRSGGHSAEADEPGQFGEALSILLQHVCWYP
jgi:hypothetical protein